MKISVAMCTYNGAPFLEEQLTSILTQSQPVQEIICCDDGSTDDTIQILETFANSHPGLLSLYRNEEKLGPRLNFEKAISLCKGDIICLCDQDDCWLPHKIKTLLAVFEQRPGLLGLFSNGWLMDEKGTALEETMWDALYFEAVIREQVASDDLFFYILMNGNIATGTALAIRKEALAYILPFYTGYHTWHDHWIALVLSAMNRFDRVDEPLLSYRVHGNQQVGFPGRQRSNEVFRKAVHDSWLRNPDPATQRVQASHLAWALQAFERVAPEVEKRTGDLAHITNTRHRIIKELDEIKGLWFRQQPWLSRKIRLLRHWLKGGEHLRITWKEVISI